MPAFDRFTALSFDCYGTLIDWETGIAEALRPWALAAEPHLSDDELIASHARFETRVQQAHPQAPYPLVLAETLRLIAAEHGRAVDTATATAYGESVPSWPAFPDSASSLARLAERFSLIILSNVDRASFAASNGLLGVTFDLIVTAEDVGSYKPDLAGFRFMLGRAMDLGIERHQILHVAESLYHDHEPAQRLGLASAWIHRRHLKSGFGATAPPGGPVRPDWRFPSLRAFADAVEENEAEPGSGHRSSEPGSTGSVNGSDSPR